LGTEIEQQSDIARGQRLRAARELAGLTATKLAEIAEVSRCSVSYWENAHVGLTRKAAEKIIAALLKEGIRCELGWLWLGEGHEPVYNAQENMNKNLIADANREDKINIYNPISSLEREIALFLSLNPNAVAAKLEDDLMLPLFLSTDIVGGIWRNPTLVSNGQVCIVKVGSILRVRKIKKTKKGFEISHLHPKSTDYLKSKDIDFSVVAPVIRLWRH